MLSSSPNPDLPLQEGSLQIKQDDKFFSRLPSKGNSISTPSFRVYYGGVSGSVPFLWESQPGTPKHPLSATSSLPPPLTPPPSSSYHVNNPNYNQPTKKHSRSKILHTLFLRIKLINKKAQSSSSSPSSSSSSLSSLSWAASKRSSMTVRTSKPSNLHRRNRFWSPGSSFDDEEEEVSIGSPTSTLCFGSVCGKDTGGGGVRAGHSVLVVKRALLAMVGRGSG